MTVERMQDGFSLVEVIAAMVILSVGILAMAATTGHTFTRLRDSGGETDRLLAVQQAVETLRSMPYDSIETRDAASPVEFGGYEIWWTVSEGAHLKAVRLVSQGRGYDAAGEWSSAARDSTVVNIFKPWP